MNLFSKGVSMSLKIRGLELGGSLPKICVPITGKNRLEILELAKKIKDENVEIIEWRSDYYEDILDCDKVISLLKELRVILDNTVIIFTLRTLDEGGNINIDNKYYERLNLRVAESSLVDIIDIECLRKDQSFKLLIEGIKHRKVKVIGSSHNYDFTPSIETIEENLMKINSFGVDILKIATMSNSEEDSLNMLLANKNISDKLSNKAIISICMGSYGMSTRLLASAITFAHIGEKSAPGQLSVLDLRKILK